MAMADSSRSSISTALLSAMDFLWFHQAILFSEPSSIKPLFLATTSKSLSSSFNSSKKSSISEDEQNTFLEATSKKKFDRLELKQETKSTETETEKRPTRLNLSSSGCKSGRSHSSSPSSQKKHSKKRGGFGNGRIRLQKSMSCKSSSELELQEVKGFLDLGFRFSTKDYLSKRMINLIPGLQRLDTFKFEENNISSNKKDEQEQERCHKVRPYLSEAWLIRRPDSPLLNLKIPRVSTAAHMKKHIKNWAKTVATAIQQES